MPMTPSSRDILCVSGHLTPITRSLHHLYLPTTFPQTEYTPIEGFVDDCCRSYTNQVSPDAKRCRHHFTFLISSVCSASHYRHASAIVDRWNGSQSTGPWLCVKTMMRRFVGNFFRHLQSGCPSSLQIFAECQCFGLYVGDQRTSQLSASTVASQAFRDIVSTAMSGFSQ